MPGRTKRYQGVRADADEQRSASHQKSQAIAPQTIAQSPDYQAAATPANQPGADGQNLLQTAQRLGNRKMANLVAQRRSAGPVSGSGGMNRATAPVANSGGVVQRVNEGPFKADPPTFMAANLISLDMAKGLKLRAPAPELSKKYAEFIKVMGSLEKHWFKFSVDADRATGTKPAYLLTPAIEKYIEEYGDDNEFIGSLRGMDGVPPLEAAGNYIESAYVAYLSKKATTPETDVGHSRVKKDRATPGFNPDFVFTAAMNGCAFATTPVEDDDDSFDAWHFQSPDSNKPEASGFRKERQPTDWFGAAEYDHGDHAGLFEVTNVMWRGGADDRWKVLSQQNEVDNLDMTKVTGSNFQQRNLNLDPDDDAAKAQYTTRVYQAMAQDQLDQVELDYVGLTRKKPGVALEALIHKYCQKLIVIINSETQALTGAADVDALRAAGVQIRQARIAADTAMTAEHQVIFTQLDAAYKAEDAKWDFRKDKEKMKDLANMLNKMDDLSRLWNATGWMNDLIRETTAGD